MKQNNKDEVNMLTSFEAAQSFFNRDFINKRSYRDKLNYFFVDYDIIPLLF